MGKQSGFLSPQYSEPELRLKWAAVNINLLVGRKAKRNNF